MKNKNNNISLALVLSLLLSLMTACSNGLAKSADIDSVEDSEYVYKAEYLRLPDEVDDISNLTVVGEKVYFSTQAMEFYTDRTASTNIPRTAKLYSLNFDGSDIEELENYVRDAMPIDAPEKTFGETIVLGMHGDEDGYIWVFEKSTYSFNDVPESFYEEEDYRSRLSEYRRLLIDAYLLRKIDSTGAEQSRIDISEIIESFNNPFSYALFIDSDNNKYVCTSNKVIVLNEHGEFLFELDGSYLLNNLYRLSDGSITYIDSTRQQDGSYISQVKRIDVTTKYWGDVYELPFTASKIYQAMGSYDMLYSYESVLYGVDAVSGDSVMLIDWNESDIDWGRIGAELMLPNESLLSTSLEIDYKNEYFPAQRDYTGRQTATFMWQIVILSKVPAASIPSKTTLTLACYGINEAWLFSDDWYWLEFVHSFNKTNENYRIEIKDYSKHDSAEDGLSGLEKLAADILTGDPPDIIITSNIPYHQYVANGMLEDLYPFIDKDKQFGINALVEGVFRAAEINGKLYQAFPTFYVDTIWGNPTVLGNRTGWNMNEFIDVINANPQAVLNRYNLSKGDFLCKLVMLEIDKYISWSSGNVNFVTEEFITLLEQINAFPQDASYDYEDKVELIATGERIMEIDQFDELYRFLPIAAAYGEVVFKGYPVDERMGNIIVAENSLAMISTSKNKEGAWQFIYETLAEGRAVNDVSRTRAPYLPDKGFPTNKSDLTKLIYDITNQRYITNEDGIHVPIPKIWYHEGNYSYTAEWLYVQYGILNSNGTYYYSMSRNDANKILDLIDTATCVIGEYDKDLMNIISIYARNYFEGRTTAQEAVQTLQSKVASYIAAQRDGSAVRFS